MAIVETVIEPVYLVKSLLKISTFLLLPIIYLKYNKESVSENFKLTGKSVLQLLGLGALIYLVVMLAYLVSENFYDYSALVESLTADQKVNSNSFIPIALYISFGNSLLEEFLFRLIAFIKLSEFISKKAAYAFSSIAFSLYHIGMIGKSFPLPLLLISIVGLAVGGAVFDYVDERNKNIYNSWMIHMFADFAIMTVWYLHI